MFYVPVIERGETANVRVEDGNIFLFSEDGTSLTAKLPDGTYHNMGSANLLREVSVPEVTEALQQSVSGGYRYVFDEPLTKLELIEFTLPDGTSTSSSPEEAEFQFIAAEGFELSLPPGMPLAASCGIYDGYVAGGTYLVNVRFGVAIIARLFPDGKLEDCCIESESSSSGGGALSFRVGEVTTGEPGEPAAVENVGENGNVVLNFTIPRGEKGEPGEPCTGDIASMPEFIELQNRLTALEQSVSGVGEEMAAIIGEEA